ncbi:hypothetical protein C8Q79DRAFT_964477 [Trametes meyenii]|nr:hypothetical protein C8Q79DRAFT_964477 [Trametes meyenii]
MPSPCARPALTSTESTCCSRSRSAIYSSSSTLTVYSSTSSSPYSSRSTSSSTYISSSTSARSSGTSSSGESSSPSSPSSSKSQPSPSVSTSVSDLNPCARMRLAVYSPVGATSEPGMGMLRGEDRSPECCQRASCRGIGFGGVLGVLQWAMESSSRPLAVGGVLAWPSRKSESSSRLTARTVRLGHRDDHAGQEKNDNTPLPCLLYPPPQV